MAFKKCLYEITFDIMGPAGEIMNVPNNTNPVACANMASLLNQLCTNLPTRAMGCELEITKVIVVKVGETDDRQPLLSQDEEGEA